VSGCLCETMNREEKGIFVKRKLSLATVDPILDLVSPNCRTIPVSRLMELCRRIAVKLVQNMARNDLPFCRLEFCPI